MALGPERELASSLVAFSVDAALHRPPAAVAFKAESEHVTQDLQRVFSQIKKDDPACPPADLVLSNGQTVAVSKGAGPAFSGSGSQIFKSSDNRFVVKVINSNEISDLKMLIPELAFLRTVRLAGITPAFFEVADDDAMETQCRERLVVTEFLGDSTLDSLQKLEREERKRLLPEIAVAVLTQLKRLHAEGLIHGDIRAANFVFSDPQNFAKSLRMIDFGRATPYVDPSGRPLRSEAADYGSHFSAKFLSPWEIAQFVKTRRDDLFRTAEMLVMLGGFAGTMVLEQDLCMQNLRQVHTVASVKVAAVKEAHARRASADEIAGLHADAQAKIAEIESTKESCRVRAYLTKTNPSKLAPETPQIYKDFYNYCLALDADSEPAYDQWIDTFTQFGKSLEPIIQQ